MFRRKSKKTSKLRVTGLCVGNSPRTGEFPHKWPVTRKMFPFDDVIMRSRDIVDQSELRIEWQYCNGSQILFKCKLEEIMNCLSDNVLFELYCVGLQLMSVDANGRMITCLNIAPPH